ncbi:MAG: outer membrane beta-barrel protein [Chryseolinea sp.]
MSILGAVAQDACEVTLNMATEEFNTGHFYGVADLLSPCLEKGQNREWRQRAYLLLTQTYLLLDDPIGAKNSYLKVLEANPEYVPKAERDPIDLVYFSSKFTTSPQFSLFAYTGPNVSQVNVLYDVDAVTANPTPDPLKGTSSINKKYALRPGYQFGAGLEWHYDENLSATVEVNYMRSAYKKTTTNIFGRDEIDLIDRQNWFRLPIAIKFSDHIGKYRPYGYIGFSLDYLLSDKAILTTINNDSLESKDSYNSQTSESPLQDFTSRRNRFNQSLFIGGGVKYKIGLNYAFIDVRYSFGMRNVVNPQSAIYNYNGSDLTSETLLNNGEATFSQGHVDDLFRMNNVVLSFGFIRPLYRPRELKKAKTKSILRRIKKQDDKG